MEMHNPAHPSLVLREYLLAGISAEIDLLLANDWARRLAFGQKFKCNTKFTKPSKK